MGYECLQLARPPAGAGREVRALAVYADALLHTIA